MCVCRPARLRLPWKFLGYCSAYALETTRLQSQTDDRERRERKRARARERERARRYEFPRLRHGVRAIEPTNRQFFIAGGHCLILNNFIILFRNGRRCRSGFIPYIPLMASWNESAKPRKVCSSAEALDWLSSGASNVKGGRRISTTGKDAPAGGGGNQYLHTCLPVQVSAKVS